MVEDKKPIVTKNFLKHLAKGGVNSIPLVGGLIAEMIFGTLEGEAAAEEAAKLRRSLADIQRSLEGQSATLEEVLARLNAVATFKEEISTQINQLPSTVRDVDAMSVSKEMEQSVERLLQRHGTRLEDATGDLEELVRRLEDAASRIQPKAPEVAAIFNVPYQRNPHFTGRDRVLQDLHAAVTTGTETASIQTHAISGLGGIGKTQTAVEFAYRYHDEYKDVLWAKADSREALMSGFVAIAGLRDLPEKDAQDQNLAVAAVKRWLETTADWLLILDNADDLAMVREFLPSAGKGHVLLTTRAQATGGIQGIEIKKMEPGEGALFLLRRAKRIANDAPLDQASAADRAQTEEISKEMDGLPLALD